jgi:hypothetical protein
MLKPCCNRRWSDFTWTIAATDYALKAVIVPFIAALKPLAPGIRVRIIPESRPRCGTVRTPKWI